MRALGSWGVCGQDESAFASNKIKKAIDSLLLENVVTSSEEQQPE
jgi:hypothetical protein